jgi:anti-anti-sigma regulatory factor
MAEPVTADEVGAGDHACLTFTDPEERLDLIAAFVRDGLRSGCKVVCWTETHSADGLAGELASRSVRAKAALGRGQLLIAPMSTSLLANDSSRAATMVDLLSTELDLAGRKGYQGLRVTVDMAWAAHPLAAADELIGFESKVSDLFADSRLCLICQYDRDRFDAVTLAFAAKSHTKAVAAQVYYEHALLRICRQYSPAGVRIAGELDYRHRDVLEQALGESMRLDRRMHVNLSQLDYLDGACAATIVAAAARLSPSRRLTVTCRRAVAKVLDLVGARPVPQLVMKVLDDWR